MNGLDKLHQKAINGAYALRCRGTASKQYLNLLEASQWWSWVDIQALQMRKLSDLLEHAYSNVSFYRKQFADVGIQPSDIQSPFDLCRLPILTKEDIQDHMFELTAGGRPRRQWRKNHTGGSTGHPLTFYQDDRFQVWAEAERLRTYRMAGYELGMRWAFLWGSDYDARSHKGWFGELKDRVVYNCVWINTFDLSAEKLSAAAQRLEAFNPQIIVAYVSSAMLLARLLRDRKIASIRPQGIQTSAEVLTRTDRDLLQTTFGCPIYDRYGCREVYNIAHECDSHEGLHILAENNLVEVLDAEGRPAAPGSLGRIVVTNLNNYAMPFIRYEVGDLAVPAERTCSCGRGLPLLDSVVGRTSDLIVSPSGRLLHGEFFTHLFYKIDHVKQFRVIQKTRSDLWIQLVPHPGFDQTASFAFLTDAIHRFGDPEFRVRIDLYDHLAPSTSGKYRFTVSEISANPLKELENDA